MTADYGLELCLKAALLAKPAYQLFLDGTFGKTIRFHHVTDENGSVLGSFGRMAEAFQFLLDLDVKFVVVHTETSTLLVGLKHLKNQEELDQWRK